MKEGDTIEHDDHPMRIPQCAQCAKTFFAFADNAGHGCASTAYTCDNLTHVKSNYGSEHDTTVFILKPGFLKDGMACDACINKVVKTGALIDVNSYMTDLPVFQSITEKLLSVFPSISNHELIEILGNYPDDL